MNFWWCNQSGYWEDEFRERVICSSTDTPRPKFRKTVRLVRKDDITLHYRTAMGIVAVSRALEGAVACKDDDTRRICLWGRGYAFPAEYHVFQKPIPRDSVLNDLLALKITDGPVVHFKDGRVQIRQAYFMPFSAEGFQITYNVSDKVDWPQWAAEVAQS
jgi:hypothetical protein